LQHLLERFHAHRMLGRVVVDLAQQDGRAPLHLGRQRLHSEGPVLRRLRRASRQGRHSQHRVHGFIRRIEALDRGKAQSSPIKTGANL